MQTKFSCMTAAQAKALTIIKPVITLSDLNDMINNACFEHKYEITVTDTEWQVPDDILWAMNDLGYIIDIHTSRIQPHVKYYTFKW